MNGRFTQRAQQVFILSREEAGGLNHPYLGTEHVLLGLIREGEGLAAKALGELGIQADQVREMVEQTIGRGENEVKEIVPTARVKKVIELSVEEARRMGNSYVGTEHILLGLIREGEGMAAQILAAFGVDEDKMLHLVAQLLGGNGSAPQGQQPQQGCAGGACGSGKTVALDQFGRDLTAMAREDGLDPVVGREKEIERVVQILSRRTKNNPVLIGDPGVGKTAIVEGLAQRIISGSVPEVLTDKRLVTLDLASLVAGTKYRGEFEDRLKKVVEEITREKNIIVFIDELHTIIGAGAA